MGLQDDLQRTQGHEATAREMLHSRLEKMVLDVEDVISSKQAPESQNVDLEIDELYELCTRWARLRLTRSRFRQKFKSFIDQYELREIQFLSLLRTKDLEIQYQNARFERQRKAQEMETSKSHQLTRQVSTFSQTESELRTQLNIYVEKFKQVLF